MTNLPEAKKSLGQHWLKDSAALNAMCEAAGLKSDDTVLEIGPGTGTLTEVLLDSGAEVTALELDESLAADLINKFSNRQFYLRIGNVLEFDLSELPADYKIVASIPYYLTSHLIRVLSESSNPPNLAVLLVQKEVAERVAARPGKMSLLSVSAQFYWQVSTGQIVPAKLFEPPPKVDSQILILKKRAQPLFPVTGTKQFFRVVKAGFSARRKTLINSLAGGLRLNKPIVLERLELAGINPASRSQELSLDEWHKLQKLFTESP